MAITAIQFENVSKQYRLGLVSTRTIKHDINRWWQTAVLRREDPYLMIGETNDWSKKGSSDYIWALRGVDFEVQKGEVIGIIGKNGAGKSTLLKLLSRITAPTLGAIKAKGRIASLLEVGTGFHPELTGRENIFMNGCIMGMSTAEVKRKMDEIIDFAGVERYIDTPVKRYSSGMTVRLGFSIAAHLEPEILVVDEVLAVGDAEFQKKAIGKMQDVSHGHGRTVLFVSHNMGAVKKLCRTGVLLDKGALTFSGMIDDVVDEYLKSSEKQNFYQKDGFIYLDERAEMFDHKVFKKMRLLDKNNQSTEHFFMADPMTIEIEIEHADKYPNADYGIAIFNSTQQRITSLSTWMNKSNPTHNPKQVRIEIPSLKLVPGMYSINLSATYHDAGIWIDKIENCAQFQVNSIDIYNLGQGFTPEYGLVMHDGTLKLLDSPLT